VVIAIFLLLPLTSLARISPVGPHFRVNEYTNGMQRRARVAALPDGAFVVTWSSEGQDGDGAGVFARVFPPNGEPPGPEFQVNTTSAGDQISGSPVVMPDGTFLVSWGNYTPGFLGALARRFRRDGAPVSSEFPIRAGALAATSAGEFVVSWTGSEPYCSAYCVVAQLLRDDATPKAPAFLVNEEGYFNSSQYLGELATLSDDSFVVVWESDELSARLFNSDAVPITDAFEIGHLPHDGRADVCADGQGRFVVAWERDSAERVFFRRYDGAGEALSSGEAVTPEVVDPQQDDPAVACAAHGDFVVVWRGFSHAHPYDTVGKYFRTDGSGSTELFRIGDGPGAPEVAFLGEDAFVLIGLKCSEPGEDCDVFGQRFSLSASAPCAGDCNHDGRVTIDELVMAVDIALDSDLGSTGPCLAADTDWNAEVSISEVVSAVASALEGCP